MTTTDKLKAELLVNRYDIVRWAENSVWIKRPDKRQIEPLVLERRQRDWLRTATRRGGDGTGDIVHSVCVASYPKREGKTLLVAILQAHRMACFTGQENVVLANSLRQAASNIFDELVGIFRNSPRLEGYVTDDDFQTRQIAIPELGNVTTCVPCNFQTVQGMAVTGILGVDELHSVPDARAYNFLRAQTEALDAQTAIASQAGPPVNSNPMWRLYEQRGQPHIFFDYSQEHIAPWAIALAEQHRFELTPAEFDYLHVNMWAGVGYKLFASTVVQKASMAYKEPQSKEEWKALIAEWGFEKWGCVIGIGLDRAGVSRKGDRSVWSAIARFDPPKAGSNLVSEAELRRGGAPKSEARDTQGGGQGNGGRTGQVPSLREGDGTRTVASDRAQGLGSVYRQVMTDVMPTGSEAEVLEARDRTIAIFGQPDSGLFESYGCSDVVEKVDQAELVVPTIPRQRAMFNTFGRLLKEGRYGFAEDAGWDHEDEQSGLLKTELIGFEHHAQAGGSPKFGTQSGLHDDAVYSAGWTIDGLQGVASRGEAPYMAVL